MSGNSSIWKELYKDKRARRTVKKQNYLAQFIKSEHAMFLELFTATGQNYEVFKSKNQHATCIGIDYNHELCCQAKNSGFLTVAGDCRQFPFEENTFDLIYVNSFHHVSDCAEDVLQRSMELLKPGGLLVGIEPYGTLCSFLAGVIYYLPDSIISLLPSKQGNYVRAIKYECRDEGVIDWYFGEYNIKKDISRYNVVSIDYDSLRIFYCIQK